MPDLHSFPTRRSSDLLLLNYFGQGALLLEHGSMIEHALYAMVPARSEEHTSELQSLRHIVCRLLLEKKKRKRPGGVPMARNGTSRPASRPFFSNTYRS